MTTMIKKILKDFDEEFPTLDHAWLDMKPDVKTFLLDSLEKILKELKENSLEARDITYEVYLEAIDVKDIDQLLKKIEEARREKE